MTTEQSEKCQVTLKFQHCIKSEIHCLCSFQSIAAPLNQSFCKFGTSKKHTKIANQLLVQSKTIHNVWVNQFLSQSSLFCFTLSPLSSPCPSNQLWLQVFSGLVASELTKDHQQCRSHNSFIVIVTQFCRLWQISFLDWNCLRMKMILSRRFSSLNDPIWNKMNLLMTVFP